MVKYVLTLFLVPVLGAAQSPAPQDAKAVLARAEILYYEAKFKESLELLLPLDAALRPQGEELRDKINVKLQMALDHIGLNETAEAKLRFAELSALDSNYSLDPQQFSPKVMAVFEDAKSELGQGQCRTFCVKVQEQLDTGNSESLDLIGQSTDSRCGCLTEFAADVARISYKQGVDAYNRNLFTEALQKFRTAVKFQPGHELAWQYIELTENKARLAVDQLSLDWRKNFDAGQYAVAADRYRKLVSLSVDAGAPALEQMRGEYRKALPPLLESWSRACQASNLFTMASVRAQAIQLLPDPAIGQDILAQMTCAQKTDTPKEAIQPDCIQMESQLAMTRVRTRVNPVIAPVILSFVLTNSTSVLVQVRVRIDEKGNAAVNQIEGEYPSNLTDPIKAAVQDWKFIPALVQNEPRCVETILSIVIRR